MDDLKTIKKLYGEKMMHICRELFPVILETPGKLSDILLNSFEPNKCLYDDLVKQSAIEQFKNLIYSIFDKDRDKKEEDILKNLKNPSELLSEAGYILYECKTEEEIQSFRKYYKKGEELCTFNGGRLDRCHVFFAVKKDVDKIKREDFKDPKRQDEYGTSVISIQFSKDSHNTLSIKNRYNHTVPNCDSTFSNNLDNIIPGLTESFKKYYNLNFENKEKDFELDGYVRASDGKLYKYNYEINNIYYCPDNIIIDNFNVIRDYQQMERYIVLDYFIIDLKEKKIELYDKNIKDSFIDDLVNIEKIDVEKDKETGNKEIKITIEGKEPIIIKIDKENNIIGYENNNIKEVNNDFLGENRELREILMSNVERIGNEFLRKNTSLKTLSLPNVKAIGSYFLSHNKILNNISLPNVETIGGDFLCDNKALESITLPNVNAIGAWFLRSNNSLNNISLPKVETIESFFLRENNDLKTISLPKVKTIGSCFLGNNKILNNISLPNVENIGDYFLEHNNALESITLPNVETIGSYFLSHNKILNNISLPNVETIRGNFFCRNESLESITLPNVKTIGRCFLDNNKILNNLSLPNVETIGDYFLSSNKALENLTLPNVNAIGVWFLRSNNSLNNISLPKVETIGSFFLEENNDLETISLPKVKTVGEGFLYQNKILDKIKKYVIAKSYFWKEYKQTKKTITKMKKTSRKLAEKINEKRIKFINKVKGMIK